MKNNNNPTELTARGFAPIYIILAIVVIGGAVFALVSRDTLKTYFQTGDIPSEQQFTDTIDSAMNLQDDGITAAKKVVTPVKEYPSGDTAVKSAPVYQAKVLTQTETEFKLDAAQPVTFRWTPVVPKPQEPVMYRLKVWQLMQGQNGSQAMKTNPPIVTKDVADITEATVSNIYTGPCRPPYLCDYIWSVEAMTTKSSDTGSDASTGAPTGTSSH